MIDQQSTSPLHDTGMPPEKKPRPWWHEPLIRASVTWLGWWTIPLVICFWSKEWRYGLVALAAAGWHAVCVYYSLRGADRSRPSS
jgi:hypothetical protein